MNPDSYGRFEDKDFLQWIVECFNTEFLITENTQLLGGFDEPYYLPSSNGRPAQIQFTRDYWRSALHEAAHWCLAGKARRLYPDFGYWYVHDGRSEKQQAEFYCVEVKPQAMEAIFCRALGLGFSVSADNLNGPQAGTVAFQMQVEAQMRLYDKMGLPPRAQRFYRILGNSHQIL